MVMRLSAEFAAPQSCLFVPPPQWLDQKSVLFRPMLPIEPPMALRLLAWHRRTILRPGYREGGTETASGERYNLHKDKIVTA
jgi:hypothetical protein